MNPKKYLPLDVLHIHVDNHLSFERHKKKLAEVKSMIEPIFSKRSENFNREYLKRTESQRVFQSNFHQMKIDRENELFAKRLVGISHRKKVKVLF